MLFLFIVVSILILYYVLGNVQTLKEFLGHAEAEVRSLASLYSNVVRFKFSLKQLGLNTGLLVT